jgi:diguanylate cyclase (GGDEF)-like protein
MKRLQALRLPLWSSRWSRCTVWLPALLLAGLAAASPRVDDIERSLRSQPEAALRSLAPVLADAQGEERVRALLLRAALLQRMADLEGQEATALALDELAARSPLAAAAAQLVRGNAWARQTPLSRADRALATAAATLPPQTPDDLRLRFVAAQAAVRQSLGKLDEAVALYQQAVQLADRAGPPWRRAELRSQLAYTLFLANQIDSAQALNAEATALAGQAQDLNAQARASNTDAILFSALGRQADELRASQQAITLARQSGDRRMEALATANLADFHLKRGDYGTALALAQKTLPLAREVRDLPSESVALINAGLAHIGLGRPEEGTALIRQALLIEERTSGLPGMSDVHRELGHAMEKAGRLKEAWAALVEHRRLSDIVFQRDHQQAVLELQEGQDADRRRRELAALEVDNNVKAAQLLGRELQQRLWALGLLAGLLLLAVVALLLRRMRQTNARLRSSNAELKVATERDPLTGLANRRHFQAVMQQTAAAGFEGALLLIDLDHFKRINDHHGHAAGDAVLVEMAQRLRAALREEDLTVRWGGEEFLVVVRQLPADQVEALAERLLAAIGSRPVAHGDDSVAVTASIGFATFPLPPARAALPWERAIDVVDTALYLAKAHGRNRAYGVRSLQPDMAAGQGEPGASLETAWREGQADLAHLSGPDSPADGGPPASGVPR